MKVSVSTYSYSQLINSGRITQFDCIAKAKEMGSDAVEIESIHPHDGSSQKEYAQRLGKEANRLNFPISNFTFGADFINGCNGDTKEEITRVKGMINIAEILGANSVRHDATLGYTKENRKYRGFDDALPIIVHACREVTEYALSKGIRTMVENHGLFCQSSASIEKLVNTVAHENFGLLTDMGNFLCVDEDPAIAFGRVAPYAFYAHAKDFHIKSAMGPDPGKGFFQSRNGNYLRGAIIGHGNVPVKHCLKALKQAGYNGYIAVEFEGIEDPILGVEISIANLKRYIGQL